MIGDRLRWLLGRDPATCPAWPPDAFACAATLLKESGSYVRAVELPDAAGRLGGSVGIDSGWPAEARRLGEAWRQALVPPAAVAAWWAEVVTAADVSMDELADRAELVGALLRVVGAADEACWGSGIASPDDDLLRGVESALVTSGNRSIAEEVAVSRARVLPKQHAPQRGMTIRSLTHNLALLGTDVQARWSANLRPLTGAPGRLDILNVLVIPWPLEVERSCFRLIDVDGLPDRHAFFEFERDGDPVRLQALMRAAVASALEAAEDVDLIVFPELALTPDELEVAQAEAEACHAGLVAGVLGRGGQPVNEACIDLSGITGAYTEFQRKHHRWCLDRWQIENYRLHGRLPLTRDCWEHHDMGAREVGFFTIDEWLTSTVLICEDLARQDPMGGVVRAVGPNLLIALLMDSPQLQGRWGSRYASVLAEDPGCSVLTVTSLGMARLDARFDDDQARTVALWRDVRGQDREITLPDGCNAVLLSLVKDSSTEFTADGRSDGGVAHFPVLAGVDPLEC